MTDPGSDQPRRNLRPLWVGLTIVILAFAASRRSCSIASSTVSRRSDGPRLLPVRGPALARHRRLLHERQLSGPYEIQTQVDNLYPPHALYLFVPFLVLPDDPVVGHPAGRHRLRRLVVPAGSGCGRSWRSSCCSRRPRPDPLRQHRHVGRRAFAGGVRWAWPSVLVTFKPSLAFFAIIGIRSRSWWIAAAVLAVVSLPFLSLWLDYPTVMSNSDAKFWYSFGNLPFFVLPIVAYLGSSRRGETPFATGPPAPAGRRMGRRQESAR